MVLAPDEDVQIFSLWPTTPQRKCSETVVEGKDFRRLAVDGLSTSQPFSLGPRPEHTLCAGRYQGGGGLSIEAYGKRHSLSSVDLFGSARGRRFVPRAHCASTAFLSSELVPFDNEETSMVGCPGFASHQRDVFPLNWAAFDALHQQIHPPLLRREPEGDIG